MNSIVKYVENMGFEVAECVCQAKCTSSKGYEESRDIALMSRRFAAFPLEDVILQSWVPDHIESLFFCASLLKLGG